MTDSREMVTDIASRRDIQRYLDHLRARRCSPVTLKSIRSTLHHLATRSHKPILTLDVNDIELWQALRARQIGTGSLRTQLSYVRNFYRWAMRFELIDRDPTRLMEMPRAPRRRPRPIRDDQLQIALDAADVQMRAVLGLAAFAGLRACEVARLDWSEVWLGDRPQLRVVGKGGHEDTIDVSPPLADLLSDLQRRRRGPVIPRADGAPGHNTPTRISQMANRHLRACDIPDTFHALRHRYVTRAYEHQRDIRAAQRAARHANITTTSGYAAVDEEAVRAAIIAAGSLRHA